MPKNYALTQVDDETPSYMVEWEEENPDALEQYLVENNFEQVEEEGELTQFAYETEDGRLAYAWIDEEASRAALQIEEDIYELAQGEYDEGVVPMELQGVMDANPAVSVEDYLQQDTVVDDLIDEDVVDDWGVEYEEERGVPTNTSPRLKR